MKNILIIILIISLNSCSKNNDVQSKKEELTNNLIGKWKYVEFLGIDVSNPNGVPYLVSNGYTITFNEDFTFISTETSSKPSGTYVFTNPSEVVLTYTSLGYNNYISKRKIIKKTSTDLTLDENYGNCLEGCAKRYIKISE